MEVLSVFTSSKEVIKIFDLFITNYKKLKENDRDNDTIYFTTINGNKNEIYYHFSLNDVAHEFSYNYTPEEVAKISAYFGTAEVLLFDISYRNESFLFEVLVDFKEYLLKSDKGILIKEILLSHPIDGIREWP